MNRVFRPRPLPRRLLNTPVVFVRDGVALPAQDFNLSYLRIPSEHQEDGGEVTEMKLQLMGLPESDVKPGDLFTLDGKQFQVTYVRPPEAGVMRVIQASAYA